MLTQAVHVLVLVVSCLCLVGGLGLVAIPYAVTNFGMLVRLRLLFGATSWIARAAVRTTT